MKIHKADAIIVGAGLAGERAAIEIASGGFKPILISLVPPRQSHSNAAQGGIQASLANIAQGADDNWKTHFDDTVKGSDWGANQRVVEKVCKIAPRLIRELEYWGAVFSRTSEGKINQRNFGGTSKPRCAFASDGTGHILLNTLDARAMAFGISVFSRRQMLSLIHDGKKITGITALDIVAGCVEVFLAPVVILATGGAGQLYRENTNAGICFGDGIAAALETGLIPIGNPEAIQFHPTPLVPTSILVTEGCRGDGGVLLDKNEYEFMWDYSPTKGNLASRDVVSRAMITHIKKGFGVDSPYGPHLWLDIKRLGYKHVKTKLADVDFLCRTFVDIDPTREYIPVRPAQHFVMFGIKTNDDCEVYGLKGLYAVGECACWDLHGFNRLGGNSLLETVAAGYVAGINALKYIDEEAAFRGDDDLIADEYRFQERRLVAIRDVERWKMRDIFLKMRDVLSDKVGIFRNGDDLKKGLDELGDLHTRTNALLKGSSVGYCSAVEPNLDLQLALRLSGMIKIALCIVNSALLRTESRGSHYREDYLSRDDKNWLKRTLAYFPKNSDLPVIKYEPVEITLLPPADRGYGENKNGK